jgi:signal transduction histidine kinase
MEKPVGQGNTSKMSKSEELALLQEAFNRFTKATESLQQAYGKLEKEAQSLKEELAAQKEYLELILESISEGVVALDVKERVEHLNRAACKMLESSSKESKGRVLWEILETEGFRKEVDFKGKILILSSSPLIREGEEVGSVVVIRDITRQKELEETASRQQRMTVMGEMATSIAHEIRNPLGSIELFAGLLKRTLKGTEEERWVESILAVTSHMETVISNLLLFARPFHPNKRLHNVKEILEESILMTSHAIQEKGIVLKREFGETCHVLADSELLKQALLNLILNAIQAMDEGGELYLGWICQEKEVTIEVKDTGPGIPKEALNRIFEPFYSTKRGGTGLGLAIVKRVVDEHKGRLQVESDSNNGTTFKIILSKAETNDKMNPCLSDS